MVDIEVRENLIMDINQYMKAMNIEDLEHFKEMGEYLSVSREDIEQTYRDIKSEHEGGE